MVYEIPDPYATTAPEVRAYMAARVRRVTEMIASAIETMPGSDEGPYCRDAATLAREVGEQVAAATENEARNAR